MCSQTKEEKQMFSFPQWELLLLFIGMIVKEKQVQQNNLTHFSIFLIEFYFEK